MQHACNTPWMYGGNWGILQNKRQLELPQLVQGLCLGLISLVNFSFPFYGERMQCNDTVPYIHCDTLSIHPWRRHCHSDCYPNCYRWMLIASARHALRKRSSTSGLSAVSYSRHLDQGVWLSWEFLLSNCRWLRKNNRNRSYTCLTMVWPALRGGGVRDVPAVSVHIPLFKYGCAKLR